MLFASLIKLAEADNCNYTASVTADFASRDQLSQYTNPRFKDSWGPKARVYPPVIIPPGCDKIRWQQARIVAVAKKYLGLPYRHHHTPGYDDGTGTGLDCSNFTSWVYNYGLGIKFTSNVKQQSLEAGRKLAPTEPLAPGDLLFIRTLDDSRISHVVIYLDPNHIIDDHASGVKIREFKGWYKNHFAYARRIIE
jgi:hypothetical protein